MSEEPPTGAVPRGPMAMSVTALLRLLHLCSPALPVGAYAYSQGLEYAIGASWVYDEESTFEWLHGIARRGFGSLDLPVLLRLRRAWSGRDEPQVRAWTAWLLASRETSESRAEDLHLGRALARILAGLDMPEARAWENARPAFATLFALASVRWNIPDREAMSGYLWSWSENQVLAAVKLIPLGQSAGQRLLHRLIEGIPGVVDRASALRDDELGSSAISQLAAIALHETQYTRLFRS